MGVQPYWTDIRGSQFADGSTYSGRWSNGEMHGQGEYTYTNGE